MRAICPRWGKLAHTQFWGRYMCGTSKVIYFERANRGLLPSQDEKGAGGPFQRFLFRGRAADHTTLSGAPALGSPLYASLVGQGGSPLLAPPVPPAPTSHCSP